MKGISNKHIFICIENDSFLQLFVDVLVSKTNLNKDDFAIVIIPLKTRHPFNKVIDAEFIDYNESLIPDLVNAKSLTFMSLNNWNSVVLNKLVDQDNKIVNKIFIFIGDDEIDRWNKNFNINTFLKEDESQHISSEVIKALSYRLNFIMSHKYFYDVLKKILSIDKINVIDASLTFDILLTDQSEKLFHIVKSSFKKNEKILIGSKANSFGFRATTKILNSFYKLETINNYKFVCLNQGKHRIALMLYIFFFRLFKKINLQVEFFPTTEALTYNSMVSSISYFILQDRGGVSTARNFAKWGCGVLCVMQDSPNSGVFKDVYKIDLIDFENYDEIANKIKNSQHINVQLNRMKIMDEELRSIDQLSKIYN
jgi:hypothetical protein